MQSLQDKNYKNSQYNSNQRILQTSPTAATLKSINHNNSIKQIPALVSINSGTGGSKKNEIYQKQRDRRITGINQYIHDQQNGTWGKSIVSKLKQIKSQKNTHNNTNLPKKIEKVSQNSPSKHVYNVNMNRKAINQQTQLYEHPPALTTISHHIHPQNQQSVAQSVYLDLQQYSSIHKYQSISPYNDQFQQDKQYVKYLNKNEDSSHPRSNTNHKMLRILPRQSINLQSEESITKSHRNSSNIPHIPQLQIHTQLSNKNIENNIASPKSSLIPELNQTISQPIQTIQKTTKIQSNSINSFVGTPINTPTRPQNRIKTKQQIKYPYIAKYLSLKPPNSIDQIQQVQQDPNHISSLPQIKPSKQKQEKVEEIPEKEIQLRQNVNQYNEPNIYSGQFRPIQDIDSVIRKKNVQNNYFNRLTLQIYQTYLGSTEGSPKIISNQSLTSSILINTSSNNVSMNPYNNSFSTINVSNLKIYPYVETMNNYKIIQDIQLKTPEWLQNRTSQHTLRLILTKNTKLTQYLKYLSELQIKLKHKNTHKYLQKTQKRNDILLSPKQLLKQRQQQKKLNMNKKSITIHYDTQNDRKTSKNYSKQKSNSSNSKNSNLEAINNKLNKLLNGSDKEQFINYRKQSHVSNNSDNVQSLNVFNSNLSNSGYLSKTSPKITKKISKPTLSQIQSDDGQSNIYIKNDHNHNVYRMKTKEIQVLNILQTLLVKLSGKKCNVIIKQQAGTYKTQQDDNEDFSIDGRGREGKFKKYSSYASSKKGESEVFAFNHTNYNQDKNSIPHKQNQTIQIQFEQYLQNNPHYQSRTTPTSKQQVTCSTKLTTYSQKIKQLTNILQNKQKYIEQIKSEYDYVINNYIKTIINLKNMSNNKSRDSKSISNSNSKTNSKRSSTLRNQISGRTSKKTIRSNKTPKNQSQQEKIILSEQEQQEQFKQSQKDSHKLNFDIFENFRNSRPITFKMSHAHNDSIQEQWMGNVSGSQDNHDEQQNNYLYGSPSRNYDI